MDKKKIVVFGPIGDFGGRDVEVNIIAKALEDDFKVTVLSSAYITQNSVALKDLKNTNFNCISKTLYENNIGVKVLANISKLKSQTQKLNYFYSNNSIAKKIFNYPELQWQVIEDEIKTANLVLCCVQLTTQFFPEIVDFCKSNKIPCVVRTTGTIRDFDKSKFSFLENVKAFIHHSQANAQNLNKQIHLPHVIIDQCANYEKSLLSLPTNPNEPFRFGYLGRLSEEKGILPLAEFFSNNNYSFKIAGDGPQREVILKAIEKNTNCEYLGHFSNEEIVSFFNQIDVLVIPSLEESGPLVGLEAMAAGKLILSTDVGAMKERLGGLNAFWFDIRITKTLEIALKDIQATSKENLDKLMQANRQRYLTEYQEDKIKEKYRNLIYSFV